MPKTKEFHLLPVLSLTTGWLMPSPKPAGNSFTELQELFGWLLGCEDDFLPGENTMQIFEDQCRKHLFRTFPLLGVFEMEEAKELRDKYDWSLSRGKDAIERDLLGWVAQVRDCLPEPVPDVLAVPQLSNGLVPV